MTFQERRAERWKSSDPEDIRTWVNRAIKPNSAEQRTFRKYGEDIDGDVARAAEFFRKDSYGDEINAFFGLRMMWRFLLRHYAFGEARRVGKILKDWGEPWHWRWWRGVGLFLPRLAIAIFAGFLILSSSSGLVAIMESAGATGRRGWLIGLSAAAAVIAYGFSVGEVQQRVGRRPWRIILCRAAGVTGIGAIYAVVGGVLQYFGARGLRIAACPAFCALCAAAALVLGFVLQLFWQDRSIAEPL